MKKGSSKQELAAELTNQGTEKKNEGLLEEGMKLYRKALEADSTYAIAWYNLGVCYWDQGLFNQAKDCYVNAVKYEPKFSLAHNNLGAYYKDAGEYSRSVEHYKLAIQANPDFSQALSNLSAVYHLQGELGEAQRCAEQAVELEPDNADAHNNLGTMYLDEGRSKDAVKCFEKCLELSPESVGVAHNLLLTMNYQEVDYEEDEGSSHSVRDSTATDTLFIAHARWGLGYYNKFSMLRYRKYHHENTVNRVLRVGFISSDLRTHPVSSFIEAPLRYLNRKKIDTFCYMSGASDQRTAQLQALVPGDRWKILHGMDTQEIAALISKDKIDILVELGGHASGNPLNVMALKPSPVQASWIGYPNTTGLPTIDFHITDDVADPEDTQQIYSETLIRMPSPCAFLCYSPPSDAPYVAKLPALQNGFITFGSFNTLAKITDLVFNTWCEVLNRIPNSHILLKSRALACSIIKAKYLKRFRNAGISSDRVELASWVENRFVHLNMYNRVDICLDTFPFAGRATTCEALYMGVPVITWQRSRRPIHSQNIGATLQRRIPKLDAFVASTRSEYIDIAVKWARDLHRLAGIRADMRKNMTDSPVCNGPLFASKLQEVFVNMWSQHCRDPTAATNDDRFTALQELMIAADDRLETKHNIEEFERPVAAPAKAVPVEAASEGSMQSWDVEAVAQWVSRLANDSIWKDYGNKCREARLDGASLALLSKEDQLAVFRDVGFSIVHARVVVAGLAKLADPASSAIQSPKAQLLGLKPEERRMFEGAIAAGAEKSTATNRLIEQVSKAQEETRESFESAEKKLINFFAELRRALDTQQKTLLKECRDQSSQHMKTLETQLSKLVHISQQLGEATEELRQGLSANHAGRAAAANVQVTRAVDSANAAVRQTLTGSLTAVLELPKTTASSILPSNLLTIKSPDSRQQERPQPPQRPHQPVASGPLVPRTPKSSPPVSVNSPWRGVPRHRATVQLTVERPYFLAYHNDHYYLTCKSVLAVLDGEKKLIKKYKSFQEPYGICSSGSVLAMCDVEASQVHVLGADCFPKLTLGSGRNSSDDNSFSSPNQVTSFGDLLFIADKDNHRVSVWSSNERKFVRKFGGPNKGEGQGQFTYPVSVAATTEGIIFVMDKAGKGRIQSFRSNGTWLCGWSHPCTQDQQGMVALPDALYAVGDDGKVYAYNHSGQRKESFGDFGTPCGLCFDNKNNELVVVDFGLVSLSLWKWD